jgi:glycosyltransferase involved in cell wall biosynthesis
MHVVFVTHEYPPFIFGGIGVFVKNLASQLDKMGVTTTVICGYPKPSRLKRIVTASEEDQSIRVVRLPYLNLPPRHTIFQVLNLQKLRDIIGGIRPDVVHGQAGSIFPSSIVLRSLAPIVVTFHGSARANKTNAVRSLTRGGSWGDFLTYVVGYPAWSYIYRKELQHSDVGVSVSRSLVPDLLNEMGKEYSEKICTIRNGVDLNRLDSRYEQFENIPEEQDTILFAGRLFWQKGVLDLVRLGGLFQKNRMNMKLLVHGTGPLLGKIRNDVKELALKNMEIKGFSDIEMMRSMKKSSFVVLPSRYEACPMVILEAMSLGKIPVMYDLPYARELTNNGEYGILATDVQDMVTKIGSLLEAGDMEVLQKKIRTYARKRYSAERMARQYIRLYERLSS